MFKLLLLLNLINSFYFSNCLIIDIDRVEKTIEIERIKKNENQYNYKLNFIIYFLNENEVEDFNLKYFIIKDENDNNNNNETITKPPDFNDYCMNVNLTFKNLNNNLELKKNLKLCDLRDSFCEDGKSMKYFLKSDKKLSSLCYYTYTDIQYNPITVNNIFINSSKINSIDFELEINYTEFYPKTNEYIKKNVSVIVNNLEIEEKVESILKKSVPFILVFILLLYYIIFNNIK